MDILKPNAVIGTNSWGGTVYGNLVRGSYVNNDVIKEAMDTAQKYDLKIYDAARDYGLGKAQKMLGEFGTENIVISAKFTPTSSYKPGVVIKSFEKDLLDFKRDYIDIYWLHLPIDIERYLNEIIGLYKAGKIHHIGVSNFNLEECILAKKVLERENIKLYGVQNHYSIISREWEDNGLVEWCHKNDISFWAWAVLEEGMLIDPRAKKKKTIMKTIYRKQQEKLSELYDVMIGIAEKHSISVSQVAIAFCCNKDIVPVCGCRKPNQVEELAQAATVTLTEDEIKSLETAADKSGAKIMGADMFRFMVK